MSDSKKVIVDELVIKTSTVIPTLFLGLGGCGGKIIKRVQQHLARRPDYEDRFKALTKFAYIDTNINDLEQARQFCDETILISDFSKEDYAALASGKSFLDEDEHFTQWVPKDYRFRAGDTAGAGQIRIESRLGAYYTMKHTEFIPKLRRLVEELKTHDNGYRRMEPREVRVVIAYSVAGGTGSGAHLAMAYLMRDIVAEVGSPTVIGVAVLPTVFDHFVGVNRDGTAANGYAALKETEYLMRLGAPQSPFFPKNGITFHYDGSDPNKRVVRTKPFDFLYLIDKPESFTVERVPEAAGDGLYLQLYYGLFKEQAGDYDNYTQHQRVLVPHDFADKGIQGFTTFYASYGAAVMLVPGDAIVDYCSKLAALDMLKSQFVRVPPASEVYQHLRNSDQFFTVRSPSNPSEIVEEKDFPNRGREQDVLVDALFTKRIRLLADAELARNVRGANFQDVFIHGHWVHVTPTADGNVHGKADVKPFEASLSFAEKVKHSLFQAVASAILGEPGGLVTVIAEGNYEPEKRALLYQHVLKQVRGRLASRQAGLEERAKEGGEEKKDGFFGKERIEYQGAGSTIKSDADAAWEEIKGIVVKEFTSGTDLIPGSHRLLSLLRESTLTLVQQRYAVLQLLGALRSAKVPEAETAAVKDIGDAALEDAENDPVSAVGNVYASLAKSAERLVANQWLDVRNKLIEQLRAFADRQRDADRAFEGFYQNEFQRIQAVRNDKTKDNDANEFMLDVEALTMETGRRLWDFYYVDKVQSLVSSKLEGEAHHALGEAFAIGEDASRRIDSQDALRKLYATFIKTATRTIAPHVLGDAQAGDKPLGVLEAITLEVTYRSIYLSNRATLDGNTDSGVINEIANLVSAQRQLEKKDAARYAIRMSDDKNRDYLRDKFKRLVKEKADYLNLYDESKDQQGGLRPDKFDAVSASADVADNEDLKGAMALALGKVPKIISEEHDDPQKIVFYRAVLNVPLYVFGRVNYLKQQYHRFQGQKYRAKTLHIDYHWERELPDLDPDDAFERYKRDRLDQNVLFFGALHAPRGDGQRIIRYQAEVYQLRVFKDIPVPELSLDEQTEFVQLGNFIGESARNLHAVIAARKQANQQHLRYCNRLMAGLLPADIRQAFGMARRWRYMSENALTNLIDKQNVEKLKRIEDFQESLAAMRRAARAMKNRLSDQLLVQGHFGDQIVVEGMTPDAAKAAIEESIKICGDFVDEMTKLLDDEAGTTVTGLLDAQLFSPWGHSSAREAKIGQDEVARSSGRK